MGALDAWYTTREKIKRAVDISDTARANEQLDRLIGDASRSVDRLCGRRFTPRVGVIRFDFPSIDAPTPWRLWLRGTQEIIRLDSMTSGGAAVSTATVLLYPDDGPPYDRIELDRSGSGSFDSGATPQRSVIAYGLLGYTDDQVVAGALAEDLDASETAIDVGPGNTLGVGSVLNCDTERMIVTERSALATGATTTSSLAAEARVVTVPLSTAVGAPAAGETILVDSERMLVSETVGTNVIVQRATDGSVLAAHNTGATVYAYRALTVRRGALGTTAATHTTGTTLTVWKPEDPIEGLTIAETLNLIAQENSAYARVVGVGEYLRESRGSGLKDRRAQVRLAYGRRGRTGAI